jgi:hypothetical protein
MGYKHHYCVRNISLHCPLQWRIIFPLQISTLSANKYLLLPNIIWKSCDTSITVPSRNNLYSPDVLSPCSPHARSLAPPYLRLGSLGFNMTCVDPTRILQMPKNIIVCVGQMNTIGWQRCNLSEVQGKCMVFAWALIFNTSTIPMDNSTELSLTDVNERLLWNCKRICALVSGNIWLFFLSLT